ncbi:MAG: TnpV protein [Ruminococcaceae bacterium]|nr:TnpV protein [Oscillospiraceae bacterium]
MLSQPHIGATCGKLYQHCAEVENQAHEMFDTLVEQMKKAEGVTEQLKKDNQMEWICRIQNIEARTREVVTTELINLLLIYFNLLRADLYITPLLKY